MKINLTWSAEEKSNMSGKICAKKAVLDLNETKLAFVINSNKYNQDELIKGAKSVLGTAPIIGYSSNEGMIVPDGYLDTRKNAFATMFAIGDNETKVGTAISTKMENERETGKIVAKMAMKKVGTPYSPAYYLMIVSSGKEEEYAKGIRDVIGNVPCFGGKIVSKDNKIFTEDMIISNGIAVAFFYTNKKIENLFTSKYHETIHSGVITKARDKNKIEEIDGIKALKRYCEWTGKKVKDVREEKIYEESILKPLAVKTEDGSLTVIKQPIYGNNDYSIEMSNDIFVNTAIIQMQISKEELISSPSIALRDLKRKIKGKPKGFLLFINSARKNILNEDEIEELTNRLKKEAEDIPFLVTFTESEFGNGTTLNNFGKLMLSEIAMCE